MEWGPLTRYAASISLWLPRLRASACAPARVETTGPVYFHRCPIATHCHRWMRQANLIDRKEITVGVPMLIPELQGDTSTILDVATILDDVWVSVHATHIMS